MGYICFSETIGRAPSSWNQVLVLLSKLFGQTVLFNKSLGSLRLFDKKRMIFMIANAITDDGSDFWESLFLSIFSFDRHDTKLKIKNHTKNSFRFPRKA